MRVLSLGHPLFKLDGKPGQCSLPVSERHCPFLADVGQGQIEQFQQRIVTGERSPILGDLAQTHVHRLNRVGRVNDASYLRRVVEERRDACPIAASGFDDGRVVSVPLVLELIELDGCFAHGGGNKNSLQVSSDRLAQLPAHIGYVSPHRGQKAGSAYRSRSIQYFWWKSARYMFSFAHRAMLDAMGYVSGKGDVCQPLGCISVRRSHGPEVIFHIMKFNPHLTKGH